MADIYLAGGCFWGLEELFRTQPGVTDTEVGYMGGQNDNPTHQNHHGHAEAVKISYDETQTDYAELLDFFFRIHDPTTLNRQGNDIGDSYRSAIFYETDEQKQMAEQLLDVVEQSGLYNGDIVTTLEMLTKFWPAESYHQDYLHHNPGGYSCHYIRQKEPLL